ncbi:MAG: hypothetical protein NTZ05_23040 [Chloroflexi bacterium]|nr:hypothetical protein [Chloroflexota bacterium]
MPDLTAPEQWTLRLTMNSGWSPNLIPAWRDIGYRFAQILSGRIKLTGRKAAVLPLLEESALIEFAVTSYPAVSPEELVAVVGDILKLPKLMFNFDVLATLLSSDGKVIRGGIGNR